MNATQEYSIESMLMRYEYSFQIERWLHPEHFPKELPSKLYHLLCSVKRTRGAIELWLWEHLGLKDDGIPIPLNPRWNFAFLGMEKIQKLQLYLGACCESEAISHVILGPEVLVLKRSIGEAVYRFILRQAPVLLKTFIPAFPEIIQKNPVLQERIQQKGKWLLESLLADAPLALLQRFVLQFSQDITWDFSHSAVEEDLLVYEKMVDTILINVALFDWEHFNGGDKLC
jgi:hypothetical protein